MSAELKSKDVEIFAESVAAYFAVTTKEGAVVRSAYLLEKREPFPLSDFTGVITLMGQYRGVVCFTSPRGLLSHVLLRIGEADFRDTTHADLIGEIANQFSGRARGHFGEKMEISPPTLLMGHAHVIPRHADSFPFVLPLTWLGYEASLIVHMGMQA
jgi:chemotaxis protein CheX